MMIGIRARHGTSLGEGCDFRPVDGKSGNWTTGGGKKGGRGDSERGSGDGMGCILSDFDRKKTFLSDCGS